MASKLEVRKNSSETRRSRGNSRVVASTCEYRDRHDKLNRSEYLWVLWSLWQSKVESWWSTCEWVTMIVEVNLKSSAGCKSLWLESKQILCESRWDNAQVVVARVYIHEELLSYQETRPSRLVVYKVQKSLVTIEAKSLSELDAKHQICPQWVAMPRRVSTVKWLNPWSVDEYYDEPCKSVEERLIEKSSYEWRVEWGRRCTSVEHVYK